MSKFLLVMILFTFLGCNDPVNKFTPNEIQATKLEKDIYIKSNILIDNLGELKLEVDSISSYESVKKSVNEIHFEIFFTFKFIAPLYQLKKESIHASCISH